jgi:hypothetical protein
MTFAESDPVAQARLSALVRGLREFGWTEGRNLRIEFRGIDEVDTDRLRAYATELVGMAPDVLLAGGAAPWWRCKERRRPSRSCSQSCLIRSPTVSSRALRGRVATSPALQHTSKPSA